MDNSTQQLDKFLRPVNSPIARKRGAVPSIDFSSKYQIQSRFALLSNINIKNFVQVSGTASATAATGNGTTSFLSSALTPDPPHQNDVNFAVPYVAIYQGTAATGANQIYPTTGASITPGAYTVQGGLDFHGFGTSDLQTLSIWKGTITDNSAGNQTFLFATFWKWLIYNSSTNG